tara:strand:- start:5260 stop:6456 length:1197 start_codon:yes stop_codon:yes gene_type:complete
MSENQIKNSISTIKKVILKGPILTNTGYGVHTRQVFKALLSRNDIDLYVQPTLWGNTSWILDSEFDNGIVETILKYCQKSKSSSMYDVSYQVLLPNEWTTIAKKNVGITAGFEADIVKKSWVIMCNKMDLIITPSDFTRNAFIKTSIENNINLKTDITVINEWYYDSFNSKTYNDYFLNELRFDKNILIIGQITSINEISDRKNMLKTIRIASKFVEDKDIGIVLKVNMSNYSSTTFNNIKDILKNEVSSNVLNKIAIISGSLTIDELKSLYSHKKISCMLSGTRAEGWGLPFIESACCGLPIIATNYSAYTEYLGHDFLGIDYDLVIFNHDNQFTDKNTEPCWADFNVESMLSCLKEFFSNEEKYINKANNRKILIKQNYNMSIIIEDYKKVFESNF